MGQVRMKKLFSETTKDKIFEKNSSLHAKQRTRGRVQFLFLRIFWNSFFAFVSW